MLFYLSSESAILIPEIVNVTLSGCEVGRVSYLRNMFNSNILIVLSTDFICTLSFVPISAWACFKGLKLRMADMILPAIVWRLRTRGARQLRVAVTSTGSLTPDQHEYLVSLHAKKYLGCSLKTSRSLSKRPDASGSSFGGGIRGWSRGTNANEISFWSGRCHQQVSYIADQWIGSVS